MEYIYRFYNGIISNEISATFSILIFTIFSLAVLGLILNSKNKILFNVVSIAPNTLTSIGILGTFFGIFIGLLDFDINTINRSVPTLLEGLKVAFGTSILGLFGAVLLRLIKAICTVWYAHNQSADSSEDEFLAYMVRMTEATEATHKSISEGFNKLHQALSGDADSSVAGQLQRLRAGFSDMEAATKLGFESQIKAFNEFAEQMSKAFSEAIIDELRDVIREFNVKISEQFGDNFKQLNQAVGQLLTWQENYKDHIEKLENRYEVITANLEEFQKHLTNITEGMSTIPSSVDALVKGVETLNNQLHELHEGLASVAEMRKKAEDAIPQITEKMDKIIANIQQASSNLEETVKNSINQTNLSLEEQRAEHEKMQKEIIDILTSSVTTLDKEMEIEINRIIQIMAENLAGLTQKFVEDYSPLLEQSRRIVELAGKPTEI